MFADATQPGVRVELPGAGVGTVGRRPAAGPARRSLVHTHLEDGEATYGVCLEVGG